MDVYAYLYLLNNTALLLTLVYLFDFFRSYIKIRNRRALQIVNGIGIGLIGMFIMQMNMPLEKGFIIDSRSIVLGISGAVWGPVPTFVAMVMTSIFRYTQGGSGAFTGIIVIFMSGMAGLLWRRFSRKELINYSFIDFYLLGLIIHGLMVIILYFSFKRFDVDNFLDPLLPVLVIYPLISGLIGNLIVIRLQRENIIATLRKNEETFNIVADYNTNWDYWLSPDGRINYCSKSCYEITGYTCDEFTADPTLLERIVHPDDQYIYRDHQHEVAHMHKDLVDFRIIRKDGTMVWINHSCTPIFGRKGEYLGARASNRDVTHRKMAESEILQSKEEIKKLLEATEASRKVLLSLVEDQKIAQNQLEVLNNQLEARIEERTGQLVAANRELEAFSYSVSHDLRAPIRGIIGFSNILMAEHGNKMGEEEQRLVSIITDNAKRMGQLIDDLLAFSRLARKELQMMHTDMDETVKLVLKEILMTEGPTPADIQVGALGPAYCDPSLIRQVWINLITNAIKFSSKKEAPVIRISSIHEGNMVKYMVEDNGAGFDPKYKDKLFGVFQRLHTVNEFEGTGIGLANVKRIVVRHGGYVDATGEPGIGATFSFWLPVIAPN